ncbi:hypothetical protein OUZ56_022502 [Daphnia magna]|uniref:Uncharacterized protein n=1 Tax=Daphnia magna TaxID=35525 RepID=A0ABR0AWR5_9CRUS|nr:hypothetical protein OUZ56_022502 [Daphnia magna]
MKTAADALNFSAPPLETPKGSSFAVNRSLPFTRELPTFVRMPEARNPSSFSLFKLAAQTASLMPS